MEMRNCQNAELSVWMMLDSLLKLEFAAEGLEFLLSESWQPSQVFRNV